MAIEDWDETPEGYIALAYLIRWETEIGGLNALLRIQFARSSEALAKREFETVQLGMPTYQARELGKDILRAAERLDAKEIVTNIGMTDRDKNSGRWQWYLSNNFYPHIMAQSGETYETKEECIRRINQISDCRGCAIRER